MTNGLRRILAKLSGGRTAVRSDRVEVTACLPVLSHIKSRLQTIHDEMDEHAVHAFMGVKQFAGNQQEKNGNDLDGGPALLAGGVADAIVALQAQDVMRQRIEQLVTIIDLVHRYLSAQLNEDEQREADFSRWQEEIQSFCAADYDSTIGGTKGPHPTGPVDLF